MSIKPPITDLPIETDSSGFYEGFNKIVALDSKILIGLLILWAAVFPDAAGNVLKNIRSTGDANTGAWYMYVMAFYIVVCLALALWPSTGKLKLGTDNVEPEFSNFHGFR